MCILALSDPPEILQGPEDLHLPPNMEFDARFQCNVTGEPKPVVTWTRDGMNLNYSTDYRLVREKSNGLHTLTIEKAKESDSGMYACEASNGVGKTLARAKLLGKSSCLILIFRQETDIGR
jgi:hypothetical protein